MKSLISTSSLNNFKGDIKRINPNNKNKFLDLFINFNFQICKIKVMEQFSNNIKYYFGYLYKSIPNYYSPKIEILNNLFNNSNMQVSEFHNAFDLGLNLVCIDNEYLTSRFFSIINHDSILTEACLWPKKERFNKIIPNYINHWKHKYLYEKD